MQVETCYRILDISAWLIALTGVFAAVMVYLKIPDTALKSPLFWAFIGIDVVYWCVALFRGWPFAVRFGLLLVSLFGFVAIASIALGMPPGVVFVVLFTVGLTSLFYGLKGGVQVIAALIAILAVVGWGWVKGYCPLYMSNSDSALLQNLRLPEVWFRYLIIAAGNLFVVVIVLRYVMGDMNEALRTANSTLQQLSIEQEHRARAEEAKVAAERSAREAQKFEALGRLASGVAHDFNNALCVMKCWSSYLMEVSGDKEVQEAMADIRRSTESAEHLTQHLLAFSRGDTSKREVADLAEVVDYECRTLSRLLPKNIIVKAGVDVSTRVPLGKGQLQEMILNLAINSRDAMPNGGMLTVQAGTQVLDLPSKNLKPGRYAQLIIADTGSGMDEATMARIYEPFFTTKGPGKGTGLGLSMVYGLVSRAGGTIGVQSRVGEGTTFTILLPEVSAEQASTEQGTVAIASAVRCRVLIVETKPEIGGLIERILSREGFPVLWVRNGGDAIQAMAASGNSFGLVIIQGVLPGISSGEVIADARSRDPDTRIMIVSAPDIDPVLVEHLETGTYHLLPKPFEPDLLRTVVNEALRTRRPPQREQALAG